MLMENNISNIKLEAAMWIVKYDHKTLQADPEFIDWLNTSDLHNQVFESLKQNWQTLESLPINQVNHSKIDKVSAINFNAQQKIKQQPFKVLTYFALVASFFFVSILYFNVETQFYSKSYKTQVAQQVKFDLPDGSKISLNANSEILVHFDDERRQVTILEGDAHFNVAKDKKRPFVVHFEQHQFTALGTAFTVNTRPFLQLAVTEHKVKITYKHVNRVVQEGFLTEFDDYWQTAKVNQTAQNWRHDKLHFQGRYLKDVLVQMQPYIPQKISLHDQDMAYELISGTVNLDKPIEALNLITSGLGLEMVNKNSEISLK